MQTVDEMRDRAGKTDINDDNETDSSKGATSANLLIEHRVEHQQLGRGILVEDGRDHDRQRCPQQIVAEQIDLIT